MILYDPMKTDHGGAGCTNNGEGDQHVVERVALAALPGDSTGIDGKRMKTPHHEHTLPVSDAPNGYM
jgi:hypothetical protein